MQAVDFTGQRFGRLVVTSFDGRRKLSPTSQVRSWWKCLCDCGNECTVGHSSLKSGDTSSCGCLALEILPWLELGGIKHGMYGTKEYHAWSSAKARVTKPKREKYTGLEFEEKWLEDFQAFYDHIGPAPDNTAEWSVGRINNNLGYLENNVQWELPPEQARNKSQYSSNTSGVTGVTYSKVDARWYATWVSPATGKNVSKTFSIKKYGEEQAFQLACEARAKAIQELNAQGAGYSETHGLPRPEAQEV